MLAGDFLKRIWGTKDEVERSANRLDDKIKEQINDLELTLKIEKGHLRACYRELDNLERELRKQHPDLPQRNGQ